MSQERSVFVSPRHQVSLDEIYSSMLDSAPGEDFVVRTLAKRAAGPMPLMSADLVIAGAATRERYPLALEYPLHFRKTYYPGRLHGDPQVEFERHQLASTLVPVPPPIGYANTVFRSCLLPGTPLSRLSLLGSEPDESNIATAQKLTLPEAAGIWRLLQEMFDLLEELHRGGLVHGDAHLHNFIVCRSALELLPIDFEIARVKGDMSAVKWAERQVADFQYLLKFAIYLQCALGHQEGALATASIASLDKLVRPAETFRRAISERSFGGVFT